MAKINDVLDLSKFDAKAVSGGGNYRVAEPGEYLAEIIQEPTRSESKAGNTVFKWVYSIQDPQFPGVRVFHNTTITDSDFAVQRVREAWIAAGATGRLDPDNLPPVKGRFVTLKVKKVVDDYRGPDEEGRPRYKNEVDWVRPFKTEEEEVENYDEEKPAEVPF